MAAAKLHRGGGSGGGVLPFTGADITRMAAVGGAAAAAGALFQAAGRQKRPAAGGTLADPEPTESAGPSAAPDSPDQP